MNVKRLYIYPVKGLQGVSVDCSKLTNRGFEYDRRWMLIDSDNYFLSQRSHGPLATYVTNIDQKSGNIDITKGDATLSLSVADVSKTRLEVGVFEHRFLAHLTEPHVNKWWSEQLGQSVRMVYMSETDVRIKSYVGPGKQTEVSLADGYPYLLLGTASVKCLNQKLESAITEHRFRANILVETETPHEEDFWQNICIGSETMQVVKKCARCTVVNIDQKSGIATKQPLATLAKYRQENKKVNFGVNVISLSSGTINIGDRISLL